MTPPSSRLLSLDQFRGFTVAGMFLVNFLGDFRSTPALLRHHNTWCSLADLIMPMFFFAVGFALRLVMLREGERHGRLSAIGRGVRRGLALMLLGVVFYQLDGHHRTWEELKGLGLVGFFAEGFRRSAFQALTHIGATTLWVLPVIAASWRWRLAWASASAGLHIALSSWFWYETLQRWRVIDGGLLGFLTWAVPALAGAWAHDLVTAHGSGGITRRRLLIAGAVLMASGYGLSCLGQGGILAAPPLCPPQHAVDMWTMSQRAGSASYLVFSSGFCCTLFAVFVFLCDVRGHRWRLFDELGKNALAAYLIHLVVLTTMGHFGPADAPFWFAFLFMAAGAGLSVMMTMWCNRRGLLLRL